MTTTWRQLIGKEMDRNNDSWDLVEATWLSYKDGVLHDNKVDDLDVPFDKGIW